MKKAYVLNIGDEVLMGHTINTDLSIVSKTLSNYGIIVDEQKTIRDDRDLIIKNVKEILKSYDYLVTTGGIGPTEDDLSVEAVSAALGLETSYDKEAYENLERYFKERGREIPQNNKKLALAPNGSKVIRNDVGTAAGFLIEKDNKKVLILPGPPREVKNILSNLFKGIKESNEAIIKTVNTYGIGESTVELNLRKMKFAPDITVNTYIDNKTVFIKIRSNEGNESGVEEAITNIKDEFKEIVYDIDSDSISKSLLNALKDNNLKIAFAESITGGQMASEFTKNPGASEALVCSLVTYSWEAKIKELDVKIDTLEKYTAVSKEVANEMLDGLVNKYEADYYAITTGYASPTDNELTNGLVYIGIYDRKHNKKEIIENRYRGGRESIIEYATQDVYYNILQKIKGGHNG